jgi:transposase InsO family protein
VDQFSCRQRTKSGCRLTWAAGPNQVWSWDITYLPTTVRGIWQYLYLVIDVWSRKVVAWDVAESEGPAIASDMVSRPCLRERISKGRKQQLTGLTESCLIPSPRR